MVLAKCSAQRHADFVAFFNTTVVMVVMVSLLSKSLQNHIDLVFFA